MEQEQYEILVNGEDFSLCLTQLSALEKSTRGIVEVKAVDDSLFFRRSINNKNQVTTEIKATGNLPFTIEIKWSVFQRLLLKESTEPVKIRLKIAKEIWKFSANGMHLAHENIVTQLPLSLSHITSQEQEKTNQKETESQIKKRISILDEINRESGVSSKELISKIYERDQELSRLVKIQRGEECQICGHYFLKPTGERYVECHHLENLANQGLDCSKNMLIVCANHHRQLHYGNIKIKSHTDNEVTIEIDGKDHICQL